MGSTIIPQQAAGASCERGRTSETRWMDGSSGGDSPTIVLRHSNANLLFTDPSKRCSCKEELDGADCFTFEEFGVGSEAEGFQHAGLHSL